ncbi:MAG TPA: glutamine amidotransferase, partial [Desulfobacteraceae bacterium]|nr:glutamine amidotransferase [Desulfobacteraceae bacterium]
VLGICYGHQILARAMGGAVDYHPGGAEIGTVDIHCLPEAGKDVLFNDLPPVFKGHVVHSQTVTRLPEGAVLLARNEFEPHHGFRVGERAWGVQFHPEFSVPATRGYIHHMTATIQNQGKDRDMLLAALEETPYPAGLLRRFGRLAVGD